MEAADQTSTFRFNFSPPDESILVKEAKAQPSSNKIPINYYKMEKPDTSFKFSFSVPWIFYIKINKAYAYFELKIE